MQRAYHLQKLIYLYMGYRVSYFQVINSWYAFSSWKNVLHED